MATNSREYMAAWREQNREAMREYDAAYRERRREAIRANWRRWNVENPHAQAAYSASKRARRAGVASTLTASEWKAIIDEHCGLCARCPNPYEHIDHVVPFISGGTNTKENVQPLCGPCHQDKSRPELSTAGRRGASVTNSRR